MHSDLDALDNFVETADNLVAPPEVETHGTHSVVVPMEDMTVILTQLWKSRGTEPKIGELYEKYKALIPEE